MKRSAVQYFVLLCALFGVAGCGAAATGASDRPNGGGEVLSSAAVPVRGGVCGLLTDDDVATLVGGVVSRADLTANKCSWAIEGASAGIEVAVESSASGLEVIRSNRAVLPFDGGRLYIKEAATDRRSCAAAAVADRAGGRFVTFEITLADAAEQKVAAGETACHAAIPVVEKVMRGVGLAVG